MSKGQWLNDQTTNPSEMEPAFCPNTLTVKSSSLFIVHCSFVCSDVLPQMTFKLSEKAQFKSFIVIT